MRVLVTGHRGLLGSACVRRIGLQHEVVVYHGDLTGIIDFQLFLKSSKPDAIIHCAAKVGGVKANRDYPVEFLSQNLKIQSSVIGSAAKLEIPKLVFVGTSCLYPRDTEIPVKESSLMTGPFEPAVEAYSVAKLAGYELCKAFTDEYGFNYGTVCPSNIYGPGDNYGESAHVIPALISRMKAAIDKNEDLTVWGDGSAIREFIYSDDAADAISLVLELEKIPRIMNIGTGAGTSIKDLVFFLTSVSGFNNNVIWDTNQPTGIPKKTFDISKLSSLGWKPRTDLITGLEKTWQNFISNENIRLK